MRIRKNKKAATSKYFSLIRVGNLLYLQPTTLIFYRIFSTQLIIIGHFDILTESLLTVVQLKGVSLDTGLKLNIHKTLTSSECLMCVKSKSRVQERKSKIIAALLALTCQVHAY